MNIILLFSCQARNLAPAGKAGVTACTSPSGKVLPVWAAGNSFYPALLTFLLPRQTRIALWDSITFPTAAIAAY